MKNIFARPNPDGNGHQVSYELENSRKVHHFRDTAASKTEKPPHGAGSFHDPEHYQVLMERVTNYTREIQP